MRPATCSISVLLPTFNRAAGLRTTLDHLARLNHTGICAEFVIIDNNSTDETRQVIESFSRRLPIRYLFEPEPGKNAALNLGLAEELGDLVVFTDDDVLPRPDWLVQIADISRRWTDYEVFGGMTYVVWPFEPVPGWARSKAILGWGFASNADIGDWEGPYPEGRYPVGFNYWVRREAIGDRRFDESLGPRPADRILGDETKFQIELRSAGCKILYSSRAVVGHCVQPELVTPRGIARRAISTGRSAAHLCGLYRQTIFERHPVLWCLWQLGSLASYGARYLLASLNPPRDTRIEKRAIALREMAIDVEMLRVALSGGSRPIQAPACSAIRQAT